MSLEQFRFLSWTPCVCEWVKEREPAPKTAGWGGRWGVDREAACEFLFYCITLLKKKKMKRIKCFDPFLALCPGSCFAGGPELSPQPRAGAGVHYRLSRPPHGAVGAQRLVACGVPGASPRPAERVGAEQVLPVLLGPV